MPAHSVEGRFAAMPFPVRLPGSTKKEDTAYSAVEVEGNRSDTDVSNQSSPHVVSGWPAGPQRIGSAPIWIIGDFLLLLMPIAFIGIVELDSRSLRADQNNSVGRSCLSARRKRAVQPWATYPGSDSARSYTFPSGVCGSRW